jgi:hypothetical protein
MDHDKDDLRKDNSPHTSWRLAVVCVALTCLHRLDDLSISHVSHAGRHIATVQARGVFFRITREGNVFEKALAFLLFSVHPLVSCRASYCQLISPRRSHDNSTRLIAVDIFQVCANGCLRYLVAKREFIQYFWSKMLHLED